MAPKKVANDQAVARKATPLGSNFGRSAFS
jgi:hypothetical protein